MGGKTSKVRIPKAEKKRKKSTKPEVTINITKPPEGKLQCTMCGRHLNTKGVARSFFKSNSVMHGGNGGYIPICVSCLDSLFKAYEEALGSKKEAAKRVCMKVDAYWNETLYDNMMEKRDNHTNHTFRIGEYLKNRNLAQYTGSTYDTTIDEENALEESDIMKAIAGEPLSENSEVNEEDIRMWGVGFDALFYEELNRKYDYWIEDIDLDKLDRATETLIRQICIQEVTLQRDAASGKPIDRTAKVIDSLIGSLNLKPVQKERVKEEEEDDTLEMTPFGVWIRKIEDERPVPEPEEGLRDVDNLRTYLQTWFVGGLCNMLRIPNKYSAMYDAAMKKYTVEKPEYDNDDEDTSLDAIFERAEEEFKRQAAEADGDFEEV